MDHSEWETPWEGIPYADLIVREAKNTFEGIILVCIEHPLYLVRPPESEIGSILNTVGDDLCYHIVEKGFRGHKCQGYIWHDTEEGAIISVANGMNRAQDNTFDLADPKLFAKLKLYLRLLLLPRTEQQAARHWFNQYYD